MFLLSLPDPAPQPQPDPQPPQQPQPTRPRLTSALAQREVMPMKSRTSDWGHQAGNLLPRLASSVVPLSPRSVGLAGTGRVRGPAGVGMGCGGNAGARWGYRRKPAVDPQCLHTKCKHTRRCQRSLAAATPSPIPRSAGFLLSRFPRGPPPRVGIG